MIHVWNPKQYTDWLHLRIVDQFDMRSIWFNIPQMPLPRWNEHVWFGVEEIA